jgi:hypothetical protein
MEEEVLLFERFYEYLKEGVYDLRLLCENFEYLEVFIFRIEE